MAKTAQSATVLVTGAGRRLGRAIALDFARQGWRVGVHYHASETEALDLVTEIKRIGRRSASFPADLAQVENLAPLVAACAETLGPVTCLVNNAACYEWDSPATLDARSWQAHLDINLRAPVFLAQAFARLLPDSASGNVINVIDQKVLHPDPEFYSYTIAKSALWIATRTLAQALAPRIRVNAIAPGPVLPSNKQNEADFAAECRSTLLQRGVGIEDVTAAIRFLLDTPSVTGQMIALDSGQHLGSS
ncbi:MAG: SDR family oxidoreductase [Alphaproteobacteria bacterium]|nr:SDR family oxidoreductase [Alphaproteobacteria bacterium]